MLKAAMIRQVDAVIATLDSGKLGANALTSFCPAAGIQRLITAGPEAEARSAELRDLFEVMVV
jgi:DeoR/GlpR family transcriptional regulator of sugar metabolism